MNYWLVKTEPSHYSWEQLVKDGSTAWDGVRNYQARNNLKEMQKGDLVLMYHSIGPKEVMGVAVVMRIWFQDPTTSDDRWVAVQLKAHKPLKKPVSLEMIKETPSLQDIALIRQSRLSVMPLDADAFHTILAFGDTSI